MRANCHFPWRQGNKLKFPWSRGNYGMAKFFPGSREIAIGYPAGWVGKKIKWIVRWTNINMFYPAGWVEMVCLKG